MGWTDYVIVNAEAGVWECTRCREHVPSPTEHDKRCRPLDECYHTKYEGCEPCEHDLKRAIAQLTAERDNWIETARMYANDAEFWKAERDRYREALKEIVDNWWCPDCGNTENYPNIDPCVHDVARRALDGEL